PAAALGPLAAVLADRLPRPRVMAAVHASMCLVMLVLAWLTAVTAPWVFLLVVVGVGAVLSSVFKPCTHSLLPQLVRDPAELVAANSAYSTVEAAGTVAGPVLSGVLLAVFAPEVTFFSLAVLFAGAAAVSLTIHSEFQPARTRRARGLAVLGGPLRGFPALVGPGVRVVVVLFLAQICMRGFLNVFVVVVALTGDGGMSTGALFAAIGVGGLIGAIGALGAGGSASSARRFGVGILPRWA
ncbi:MAG: MFS transporter, partial [Geodermatophilaceae bacterium]|nr:MFS transporter [Geodermatophilaceae bacterium]